MDTFSDFLDVVSTPPTALTTAGVALFTTFLGARLARRGSLTNEVRTTLIELSDLLGEQEVARSGGYQRTRRMWVLIARLPHRRRGRLRVIRDRLERTVMAIEARTAEGVRHRYRPAAWANPTLCRYGQAVISAAINDERVPAETEELVRICAASAEDLEEMYRTIMSSAIAHQY